MSPDRSIAAWGGAAFGLVLASYGALRPVRDALVLDGNPDAIPWLFTTTFVAIALLAPAWSKAVSRHPARRLVPIVFHVFAACELGFCASVHGGVWVGRAFYVWSAVYNLFVVSVLWSLFADVLGPRSASRWYGPIAAGGTIGAIVGPALTNLLVGTIGISGVLAISAALLELAIVCVGRISGRATAEPAPIPEEGGLARIARSRMLAPLVGYVVCTACAATVLYVTQARIAHAELPDRTARAEFFSSIDVWTNAGVLVVQAVIAAPVLARVGPGVVLCALPVVQAVGLCSLAFAPSLATLAAFAIASRTATHGLTRPARELLFTVVPRDDKYRAKNFIDTTCYRFGDFVASWVMLAGASATVMIATIVPLAIVWLALAGVLGAGFRRMNVRSS